MSLASPYGRPSGYLNISAFGLLFPYIFIGSLIILLVGMRQAKLLSLLLGGLLIYSLFTFNAYIQLPSTKEKIDDGLTVMSYNAMMGHNMVNDKHVLTAEIKTSFEALMNQSPAPDIICAQEVSSSVERLLSSSVSLPHYHKIESRGAVILSRYPFLKTGVVDFGAKLNSCLWADIDYNGKPIRIYSAHLESIRLNKESYKMLTEDNYDSADAMSGIKDMLFKYHKYSGVRADQVDMIKQSMAKSPNPVILCGDFNDPPMSYTYRQLSDGLTDTFKERGDGIGSTWNGAIPLLRIDYILSDPSLKVGEFYTLKSKLSDHYPVKAVFDLK